MGNDQSRYVLAPPRFVLLGDSITEQSKFSGGYGVILGELYNRRAEVVVRGFSGYNTRWALAAIDAALPPGGPAAVGLGPVKLVTVFFGANDNADAQLNPKQHVPLAEYRENLVAIVARARERYGRDVAVVLLTPPPIDPAVLEPTDGCPAPDRLPERVAEYAGACRDAAAECGAPCVDLHAAFLAAPEWRSLLSDGLHLSDSGNKLVADELERCIREHFPQLASLGADGGKPEQVHPLPPHLPHHMYANGENQRRLFAAVAAEAAEAGADAGRTLEVPKELRLE